MSTLLEVNGVSVSFDGFKAINNLSFTIGLPEMRAVIGPNGAGKTTFMDIVTGKTRPDEGTVRWGEMGHSLLAMSEAQIAREGIGRKFQRPTVFEDQSVRDNLRVALKKPRGPFSAMFDRVGPTTARGSRRSRVRSALPSISTARRASSATGRSSGWRSGCCWRRTRASCWSTNRRRA
jgi:ABC-type uncharacterized transport system ATPase subunit